MLNTKLIEIFGALPQTDYLKHTANSVSIVSSNSRELFNITPESLAVSGVSINPNFYNHTSPLKDTFVGNEQLTEFFSYLSSNQLFECLNHVGFCYEVENAQAEKQRLLKEATAADWQLYEETSNDAGLWLFVGNIDEWLSPLIEFIPVEKTTDRWKNYWLPHFQIDIQTYLLGNEAEELINSVFKGEIKPYRLFEANGHVFLLRARLGSASGINIELDIGCDGRMLRYHRKQLLGAIAL